MRFVSAAWGVGRRALADFRGGGYRIPAAQMFSMIMVTHRDARVFFFPEPSRFDPELGGATIRFKKAASAVRVLSLAEDRGVYERAFAMIDATLLLATIAQVGSLPPCADMHWLPVFSALPAAKNGCRCGAQAHNQ